MMSFFGGNLGSRRASVRGLCGNLDVDSAPDTTIDNVLAHGDARVSVATGKSDWATTDGQINLVVYISDHFAAGEYCQTIPGIDQQKISNLLDEAKDALQTLLLLAPSQTKTSRYVGGNIDVDTQLDPLNY